MTRPEISPDGRPTPNPGGPAYVGKGTEVRTPEDAGRVLSAEDGERVRLAWKQRNEQSSEAYGGTVEDYPAGDYAEGATLAQRLHNEGLIFRINREILHPLGLSLGVNVRSETMDAVNVTGTVVGLLLSDTGGEPIEYTAEQIERNERKLHGKP